jgi:hypothetical protein
LIGLKPSLIEVKIAHAPMRPFSEADGHDAPALIDETVPGEAAMVVDVAAGFEDTVG